MQLNRIYQPIIKELKDVEQVIESSLRTSKNKSLLRINQFLLSSPGKRIRPALVILSTRATSNPRSSISNSKLINIASAFELIHTASLLHDDVVDHSKLRHNKPTINSKWGEDISIALGDYLYSVAFELISDCGNSDIIHCISSATKAMCEGELLQICERDNLSLLKERYFLIVKKKTASLFAASCQVGALLSNTHKDLENALKEFGLNFGIAFQIIDDCRDLVGQRQKLGKSPGQDISVGEITLPLLNLLDVVDKDERQKLIRMLQARSTGCVGRIKNRFLNSDALPRTKEMISFYLDLAKKSLAKLPHSTYQESLGNLTDFILTKTNGKVTVE